jgi:hypothetical protein
MTSSNRYNVKRFDGSKEGEVTLTLFECEICGKDELIPSDRTHENVPAVNSMLFDVKQYGMGISIEKQIYHDELINVAEQLEEWALESVLGGWSTHQVQPMSDKAMSIRRLCRKHGR